MDEEERLNVNIDGYDNWAIRYGYGLLENLTNDNDGGAKDCL